MRYGRVANILTAHRVCTFCQPGNLGVEQHPKLVFECLALRNACREVDISGVTLSVTDSYNGLIGDQAATMVQFM